MNLACGFWTTSASIKTPQHSYIPWLCKIIHQRTWMNWCRSVYSLTAWCVIYFSKALCHNASFHLTYFLKLVWKDISRKFHTPASTVNLLWSLSVLNSSASRQILKKTLGELFSQRFMAQLDSSMYLLCTEALLEYDNHLRINISLLLFLNYYFLLRRYKEYLIETYL